MLQVPQTEIINLAEFQDIQTLTGSIGSFPESFRMAGLLTPIVLLLKRPKPRKSTAKNEDFKSSFNAATQ